MYHLNMFWQVVKFSPKTKQFANQSRGDTDDHQTIWPGKGTCIIYSYLVILVVLFLKLNKEHKQTTK